MARPRSRSRARDSPNLVFFPEIYKSPLPATFSYYLAILIRISHPSSTDFNFFPKLFNFRPARDQHWDDVLVDLINGFGNLFRGS